jgi:hypothetical protein
MSSDAGFAPADDGFAPADTGAAGISVAPTSYASATPKPSAAALKKAEKFNAYTALLLIAFLAIALGTVLLVLEWGRYNYETQPTMQHTPATDQRQSPRDWA